MELATDVTVYYRFFFVVMLALALLVPAKVGWSSFQRAKQGNYGFWEAFLHTAVAAWISFWILSVVFSIFENRGIPAWRYVRESLVGITSSSPTKSAKLPDFER